MSATVQRDSGDNGIVLGGTNKAEYLGFGYTDSDALESGTSSSFNIMFMMHLKKKLMVFYEQVQFTKSVKINRDGYLYEALTTYDVGSVEKVAKRISNLNVFYSSGWYAYSRGSNGAPSDYGVVLHLKWNDSDFIQIAFDFANNMYQRAYVNDHWTNWKQR